MIEGWKCPVCGAGVAPTEKRCEHGGVVAAPNPFQPFYVPPTGQPPGWVQPLTPCDPPWPYPYAPTCLGITYAAPQLIWTDALGYRTVPPCH